MGHTEFAALAPAVGLSAGTTLPVARYRLRFVMHGELILPEYSGSLLRGQFGAALRRIACMTGARTCDGCPLLRTCPYPAIFETPAPDVLASRKYSNVPNPYVFEPPPFGSRCIPQGEVFEFGVVLIGRALAQLPLVVFALERAFQRGFGSRRVVGSLVDVVLCNGGRDEPIWDSDERRLLPHEAHVIVPEFGGCESVSLQITTPMRLQQHGHPLGPDEVTPRKLVTSALRRAGLLFEIHADLPDMAADAPSLARCSEALAQIRALTWRDWTRYSSRQQAEMTLGGVMGTWRISGRLGPLAAWLWLGQWLHVGKNATMGMGCYRAAFS